MKKLITLFTLLLAVALPSMASKTVYFDNSGSNWPNVYIYWYGSSDTNPSWGANDNYKMSNVTGDIYKYTDVPDQVTAIIFYNGQSGNENQTKDIYVVPDNGLWKKTNDDERYEYLGIYTEPSTAPTHPTPSYPDLYLVGRNLGKWTPTNGAHFNRNGADYSVTVSSLNGQFKISNNDWSVDFGSTGSQHGDITISSSCTLNTVASGKNWNADNLSNVTVSFTLTYDDANSAWIAPQVTFTIGTTGGGEDNPSTPGISGTLPVLYINVYNADHTAYNDEVIDKDLAHKNYMAGEYWLDVNGCQWLIDLGAENIGSEDSPLPLEIKARGNYTRTGFSKKPYKLKLGKKQNLLNTNIKGMASKHWALLTHADDTFGYLRNFIGFNIGRRILLPWTPNQQPVEVVINGDYRGLYFLTESIRVEDGRVEITELKDNVSDPSIISGGYIVELDNYAEDSSSQIVIDEKHCVNNHTFDKLRITFDTPEVYSDLQRAFVTDQFTAMNDYVGANSDNLWRYMDLDDAARYYVVEEIMSHYESYHGSTYLYRDRGEGQKWHFSPLWDFGNAFMGSTTNFFYNSDPFGNTWIPSMRQNSKFNAKVRETWLWFMDACYTDLMNDIDAYVEHIRAAAISDHARWNNAPLPNHVHYQDGSENNPTAVVDNSNMTDRKNAAVSHLTAKINWLKGQFGDYTQGDYTSEPARDLTPAEPLKDYAPKTLYVKNDANWNNIHAYIYKDSYNQLTSWNAAPEITDYDTELVYTAEGGTEYEGLYTFTVPYNFIDGQVIFYEKEGTNRYPADQQPGMELSGANNIFFTSWSEIKANPAISVAIRTSGTLPVVKITTPAGSTIGYGDEGVVAGCTIEINPLNSGLSALAQTTTEIKGRGTNWSSFDKKGYKLKFDSKAAVLDMPKSKHWVLLPYVEDKDNGLLSNYAGHVLAEYLMPGWTPDMQPVELVIDGVKKGLYFIAENVRTDDDRLPINDFGKKKHVAGEDWIIEIDNLATDELTNYSWTQDGNTMRAVSVLPEFSDIDAADPSQRATYTTLLQQSIEQINAAVADAKANPMSDAWTEVIDPEQAAAFYIVNEIMDCHNAFSTSFYIYHQSGEGQKWKFGPIWNFANAFASSGDKSAFIHESADFDGAWIADLYSNNVFRYQVVKMFCEKILGQTSTNGSMRLPAATSVANVTSAVTELGTSLTAAIDDDSAVWPSYAATTNAHESVNSRINANINWLSDEEGGNWQLSTLTSILGITADSDNMNAPVEYFDLTGRRILNPASGSFVIRRQGTKASKVIMK